MYLYFVANDYFQFQQFTVWQGRSAMKVCTDACLFGAWVSQYAAGAERALDVGAGTGLLSLMLAQKCAAIIDAVEIDGDASEQATENFRRSPWGARLRLANTSVQQHAQLHHTYDFIVSNPPFYDGDLRGPDSKKNVAHHGDALRLQELIMGVKKMLRPGGCLSVLIPPHRAAELDRLAAANGLYAAIKMNVRQTPQHSVFRSMYLFYDTPTVLSESEIVIKDNNQKYTPPFHGLMKDFYLVPNNTLP